MFMAACGGGGNSAPAVVPLELEITPTDGTKIKLDEATILPEEQNGSEADGGEPVSLGLLTDNKNGNGEAVYKMATGEDAAADNDDFEITPSGELRYIGSDSGDFETTTKKSFAISIARYKNQADADDPNSNPQIVSVTINLQDVEEVLIVTPEDVPYFSTDENGESFLDENVAGNGADGTDTAPKFLATLTDGGIESSYTITYRVANDENFRIENGNELYYVGPELDFEIATRKQFVLNIERIRDGDTDNPQTFTHTVNLKNLNDTAPEEITAFLPLAEGATEQTEIDTYIAAGEVSNGRFAMAFYLGADQEDLGAADDIITIQFVNENSKTKIVPKYFDEANPDADEVIGFEITTYILPYMNLLAALNDNTTGYSDSTATNFAVWEDYFISVKYIGTYSDTDTIIGAEPAALFTSTELTRKKGMVVESGTTGIIANFASTDEDGDTLTYSLDEVGDYAAFEINPATGALRFAATPDYADPTDMDGNNVYEITIRVSDGNTEHDKTQSILVGVTKPSAADSVQTESGSAAESVPNKEPQKWEPSPFDNIFDDDDPFGPIGGGDGGDGVL